MHVGEYTLIRYICDGPILADNTGKRIYQSGHSYEQSFKASNYSPQPCFTVHCCCVTQTNKAYCKQVSAENFIRHTSL